ncbi:MAG: gliding motility-associated C-terminal domain-containing protein [Bacteroidales bacterium]
MKEIEHIGKFVREKLEGYREKPSGHVWQNIEQQVSMSQAGNAAGFNWWYVPAGFVIVAAVVYFFALKPGMEDEHPGPEKQQTQEQLVEKKKEPSQQTGRGHSQKEAGSEYEKPHDEETAAIPSDSQNSGSAAKEQKTSNKPDIPERREEQRIFAVESIKPGITTKPMKAESGIKEQKRTAFLHEDHERSLYEPSLDEPFVDEPSVEKAGKELIFSEQQEVCAGEETTLWASGGSSYRWSTGSTDSAITITPDPGLNYSVTVWDESQNQHIHDFSLEIKECEMLYVPNAFSPNGDGYNDYFKAYGLGIESFKMQIMNRQGKVVYETENINEGWDGNYRDRPAQAGVYLYRIVYSGSGERLKTKTGTLTLIR